jgi:hypothetical protein
VNSEIPHSRLPAGFTGLPAGLTDLPAGFCRFLVLPNTGRFDRFSGRFFPVSGFTEYRPV